MRYKVNSIADFKGLKDTIHEQIPYLSFFPLIRLKGVIQKMHRLRLSSNPRYLYLNPIEGILISYKSPQKFPADPNIIIPLRSIKTIEYMTEQKWFFKENRHYMLIVADDKDHIYHDVN